jgi:CRISPR-associated protein Cmr2
MTAWLMKFGFGGVQEFIAQSRKTRDLAAGSLILQSMAKAVAAEAQRLGAEVILPQQPGVACPHQLLLRWNDDHAPPIEALGKALRAKAKDYWQDCVLALVNGQLTSLGVRKDPSLVARQLEQAFEAYWVAVPLEREEDYPTAFHDVQQRYELRRFTRTFPQEENPSDPLGTCAQCGARNAVVDPPKRGFRHGRLDPRDKLCAVCLAKRLWSYSKFDEAFPSTVHLARDRFFRLPEYQAQRKLLEEKRAEAKDWREFQEGTQETDPNVLKAIHKAMEARDSVTAYYVALYFDGNRMGEWFSGEHFAGGQDLKGAQETLSQALASFVTALRAGASCLRATVIYLGGDDGLVLLPLDYLFPFIRLVRKTWQEHVEQAQEVCAIAQGERGPTLSLHASVVHQTAPFQRVIEDLHPALEETKEQGNREAFSISVAPRAGSEAKALFRWEELEALIQAVESFTTWRIEDFPPKGIGALPAKSELDDRRRQAFPARLPYVLADGLAPLFDENGALSTGDLETAFDLELSRLLGKREDPTKTADKLFDFLRTLAKGPQLGELAPRGRLASVLTVLPSLARWLDWESGEVQP